MKKGFAETVNWNHFWLCMATPHLHPHMRPDYKRPQRREAKEAAVLNPRSNTAASSFGEPICIGRLEKGDVLTMEKLDKMIDGYFSNIKTIPEIIEIVNREEAP